MIQTININMKKGLIVKWANVRYVCFALAFAGVISACSDDDSPSVSPEITEEELAEMAAVDKFAAANSVYRALGLLDELPDNWESVTFTPQVGFAVDEANTDIRNVVATGAEHAEEYFLSIVPDEGLEGNTWSHEGVGSLTYRAVNKKNCYGVIDVNLAQMPGLKQLRFVPEEVVGDNAKYYGEPYYHVGDVVEDENGIFWICVRPSGGPSYKQYAYFVTFDQQTIKTMKYKQKIYRVEGIGQSAKVTSIIDEGLSIDKWGYAKNLVEERVALAAAHVFASFADADNLSVYKEFDGFDEKARFLKDKNILDFEYLVSSRGDDSMNRFYVPYGLYKANKNKKNHQVKYLQPYMVFALDINTTEHTATQRVEKAHPVFLEPYSASDQLLSLTEDHDPLFWNYHYEIDMNVTQNTNKYGWNAPFYLPNYALQQYNPYAIPNFKAAYWKFMRGLRTQGPVLVMTQMYVEDMGQPNPGLTKVFEDYRGSEPNYWKSISKVKRNYFEKGKERKTYLVNE